MDVPSKQKKKISTTSLGERRYRRLLVERLVPTGDAVPISQTKKFSTEQLEARTAVLKHMKKGLDLKSELFNRDSLHDR